MCVIAQ